MPRSRIPVMGAAVAVGAPCCRCRRRGGPPDDPTLIGLLGLVTAYLIFGRRRLRRQVAMG